MLPGQTYSPEDVLRIVRRRKWLLIVPFVTLTCATVAITRTLPDSYRSETVILVVPQRVPESYVRSTITSRIEDRLTTIQQQILSRTRLERIIKDFGLYPDERTTIPMEEVVDLMRPQIEVRIERGDAFRVSYVNQDPVVAQGVTERLASLFIEENLRDREVLADGANQFLDAQLDDARRRLSDQERRLEQYRRQYDGELPTQVETNLQAIQNVQLQLQAVVESVNRDQDRRTALERQVSELQNGVTTNNVTRSADRNPVGESPAEQLSAAREQLRSLEQRFTAEHPDVLLARRAVREVEAKVKAETRLTAAAEDSVVAISPGEIARQGRLSALQDELSALSGQLAKKEAEERRLQTVLAGYQARVDAAPRRESELIELTRDYTTIQNTYTSLLTKREEAKLASNLERWQIGEQFKVLDAARAPERPFSPNRTRLNVVGAFAGLVLGAALVVLLEYRDRSVKTAEDVARVLRLPVVALVPMMSSTEDAVGRRRRLIGATAAALLGAAIVAAVVMSTLWEL